MMFCSGGGGEGGVLFQCLFHTIPYHKLARIAIITSFFLLEMKFMEKAPVSMSKFDNSIPAHSTTETHSTTDRASSLAVLPTYSIIHSERTAEVPGPGPKMHSYGGPLYCITVCCDFADRGGGGGFGGNAWRPCVHEDVPMGQLFSEAGVRGCGWHNIQSMPGDPGAVSINDIFERHHT